MTYRKSMDMSHSMITTISYKMHQGRL